MSSKFLTRNADILVCAFLVVITLAAYGQVIHHEFLNYDDNVYVTQNPVVRAGLSRYGIVWAFRTFQSSNWHPLTWLSHMLDVELFGMNASPHHQTALLLHILNTLLLFSILHRMTGHLWRSCFAAALFAIHPLHVESVAWVAERKDVLSTFFWMLTIWAYARYVQRPRAGWYTVMVLVFALGLMTKPMLVTLPFVLLLLDYWPLGRLKLAGPKAQSEAVPLRRLIGEKVPLFLLAAGSSFMTYYAQQKGGAVGTFQEFPIGVRAANALVSYVAYISKTVWPTGLAIFYPHPGDSIPTWHVVGSGVLLAVVSALAIWRVRSLPYLATGWFWYVGTLVPVIGLVQVGAQSMADRYTYIPLIGLFLAVSWGVPDVLSRLLDRRKQRKRESPIRPFAHSSFLAAAGIAVIAALTLLTWKQAGYWRSSISVFEHAVGVTEGNYLAHGNLGNALIEVRDFEGAIVHLEKALQIKPDDVGSLNNLAAALAAIGESDKAERTYEEAIHLEPDNPTLRFNLGVLLQNQEMLDAAEQRYREAVHIAPDFGDGHRKLAEVLYAKRRYPEAWKECRLAERYGAAPDPDFVYDLSLEMPEPGE